MRALPNKRLKHSPALLVISGNAAASVGIYTDCAGCPRNEKAVGLGCTRTPRYALCMVRSADVRLSRAYPPRMWSQLALVFPRSAAHSVFTLRRRSAITSTHTTPSPLRRSPTSPLRHWPGAPSSSEVFVLFWRGRTRVLSRSSGTSAVPSLHLTVGENRCCCIRSGG